MVMGFVAALAVSAAASSAGLRVMHSGSLHVAVGVAFAVLNSIRLAPITRIVSSACGAVSIACKIAALFESGTCANLSMPLRSGVVATVALAAATGLAIKLLNGRPQLLSALAARHFGGGPFVFNEWMSRPPTTPRA